MSYEKRALAHLSQITTANKKTIDSLSKRLAKDVKTGKSLFVFGSGHSSIFPMELYHRAGGASFVIPLFADFLLPTAGPPVVRVLERTPAIANVLLARTEPKKGEMIWFCSQSGINPAVVDLALEAKRRGMFTVAFTSRVHSSAVKSRHASGKRLFEVCDVTVDLGGEVGDAAIQLTKDVKAGPLSSLGAILLGNAIIVKTASLLEKAGHRCIYTSVNTPEGEGRNKKLERDAAKRDPLLRDV
jgi:uncharacterized phosphosugar-binding protein